MTDTLEFRIDESELHPSKSFTSKVAKRLFDTPTVKMNDKSVLTTLVGSLLTPFPLLMATYTLGKILKIPEGMIREYGWNTLAALGTTLAFRNPNSSKSLVMPALIVTAACFGLEFSEHLGYYKQVFGDVYQDWNMPGDFIAYAVGAASAFGLDKLLKRSEH